MQVSVTHRYLYRAVTALVLVVFIQGCVRWQTVALEPKRLHPAETVRAYLDSDERVTLSGATIAGDSLMYASAEGIPVERQTGSIPLKRIQRVEARRIDGAETGVAVVATVGLVAAVVAVVKDALSSIHLGGLSGWGGVAGSRQP